jgi:hypothetical protein
LQDLQLLVINIGVVAGSEGMQGQCQQNKDELT